MLQLFHELLARMTTTEFEFPSSRLVNIEPKERSSTWGKS